MNILDMPSDHINTIRDKVKSAVHDGLRLTPDETVAFAKSLNTVSEMVREVEEENMVLNHALTARQDRLRNRRLDVDIEEVAECNVVTLSRPRRLLTTPETGGGDAA